MLLNVLDFASPEAALAAAADGDRVYFPGIKLYDAPSEGYQITKSLELFGDGPGGVDSYTGTVFRGQANQDVFVIAPPTGGTIASVYLHDFKIKTPPTPRHGIACELSAGRSVGALRLERIITAEVGGDGFHLIGANLDDGTIGILAMIECGSPQGLGWGAQIENVRSARVLRCNFNANMIGGLRCASAGVALYNLSVEQNGGDATNGQEQVVLVGCRVARVDASHFERFTEPRPKPVGIRFENCGGAAMIGASTFGNDDDPPVSTGLEVAGAGPVVVLCNGFARVQPTLIDVAGDVSDLVLLPQFNNPEVSGGNRPGNIQFSQSDGNRGEIAMPFVRRVLDPFDARAGLLVPSGGTDPTAGLLNGMFFYRTDGEQLRVRIAGAWKNLVLES